MEEALRESEKRYRELYDNAPVGYHEFDTEGRITNMNRTGLEMLGYTEEEMTGRFIWETNADEKGARRRILERLAGIRPAEHSYRTTFRRKDRSTFPVLIDNRLIKDDKGKIIGIRSIVQDITERDKAEQELALLQEQLRQSQKLEAIGQLAGGIAHDFNNLLTIIRGYGEVVLAELRKGDPLRTSIEAIEKSTNRASALTRQLLAFSRRQVMEMKVQDLNGLVSDLDRMLRRIIGEDIQLETLLADNLGRVKVDPGQIEQVIVNLAINARDAMPLGGKLTIETENVELDENDVRNRVGMAPGRYVLLSVSDNGTGIARDIKDRIFEPFFTTKEKGKGTGLGLSVVYGIVKQSGGEIWVESEMGLGTYFKIFLPRVEEPLEEMKERTEGLDTLPSYRGSETVLLVEDEEEVRNLAVLILRKQGYRVLDAIQGGDALLICEKHPGPIHLMVTDVVMPGMAGPELALRLKSLHPEMKVLFMSGYSDDAIVHHGVISKGAEFIQKPFTLDGLARKVREILDRS
jgi:PAS domain S-box-containing protein